MRLAEWLSLAFLLALIALTVLVALTAEPTGIPLKQGI